MPATSDPSNSLVYPDWPAAERVKALVTTRNGGVSTGPYESFNLATHVGDDAAAVAQNRARLQALTGTPHQPQWLDQVHGVRVVAASPGQGPVTADAVVTRESGLPCAILTADCLPVFLTSACGDRIAIAHAGWRGLAAGILEQARIALEVPGQELIAWLGPAIGAEHFEVGPEVRQAFLERSAECSRGFRPSARRAGHWDADIFQLARIVLQMSGVHRIYGGNVCTYREETRFYSYRRDGKSGRMASLIWLESR